MLKTWLHLKLAIHWADGLCLGQVKMNKAYHEGLKCSPWEAMFQQSVKVCIQKPHFFPMKH